MTQQPMGHEPAAPGPLDEPRPGRPDVGPLDERGTPEQPVIQHSGTSLVQPEETVSDDGGSPYTGDIPISTSDDIGGTSGSGSGSGSKVDAAKGEAKQVAGTAVDSGREVAATAKDEAQNVVAETKQQARSLLETVRSEVGEQAGTQQNRVADALHGLSKELGSMASSSQESGPLTDLAHQASRKGGEIAHWLQNREPTDVLEEVRSYARRRPGTFLVLCGLAGVVAGRLTRSAVATRTSLDSKNDTGGVDRPQRDASDASTGLRSNYLTTPVTEPAGTPPTGLSTGVYAGSVETTEPASPTRYDTAPSAGDPYDAPAGADPGGLGTTRPFDDPNGDPTR
jgi:vacuolar-type H+-ATPase subunit H